jgi:hypothetical protein
MMFQHGGQSWGLMVLKIALFTTALISVLGVTQAVAHASGAEALVPTQAGTLSINGSLDPWQAIEANINADIASSREPGEDVLDLSEVPILRDFVNEQGQVEMPLDLPFDVRVVDSFGGYGVGINQDF